MIIGFADLRPGDVILFHSLAGKFPGPKIAKSTGSPYTHAAIYLGDGEIAEATPPVVRIRALNNSDLADCRLGILRSQAGFSKERVAAVRTFVTDLEAQRAKYDYQGVRKFRGKQKHFHNNVLSEIKENYGKTKATEEFLKEAYFYSALVVACFMVAGIIGDSAQVVYPPDLFSPGDLHRDPTFGWLLGFIIPDGATIPDNDPLLENTLWKDNLSTKWW